MKRSEMLFEITDFLWKSNGDYGFRRLAEEDAGHILDIIEEAGMLPPETKAKPSDFTNIGFDQFFLDEHEFKVNRWEPENENEK